MQINRINSTQNFEALKMQPEALKVIKTRINELRAPEKEIEKLQKLIAENAANKFNIELDKHSGRQLKALIADGSTYANQRTESIFDSIFKSPIKFIQKLTAEAKQQSINAERSNKIDELFK